MSCSSLNPKSIDPPSATALADRPRLPEVIRQARSLVVLAERQLQRHVDLDLLGIDVGELHVHAPAAVELDHAVTGRRVGRVVNVVVGEGEQRAAPRQLVLFEAVAMAALDADAMARELYSSALRTAAAVQREHRAAVAEKYDRRGEIVAGA